MGLFKSLGQLLGGVAALVGQKAIIHSQTCDISLTEAFHPPQLFSTAVTCTGKQPPVITNNEYIIPSFDAFNTSHLSFIILDGEESVVFDYPHNSTNITMLPHAEYLPLLASAAEVGWTTFAEFYLEPACYTLLMNILLPLLLRIWRVVNPATVYHERILPFLLGARRFIIAIKLNLERAYHRCALLMTILLPLLLRIWRVVNPATVYHERILPFLLGARRFIIAIKLNLERAYHCCALLIIVLLPIILAAWQLIAAIKPNKSPQPEASISPLPTLPDSEKTYLRLKTESQAAEIEQLKAHVAADEAIKLKKIDDAVAARVKLLEQRVKSWKDVLAKEKADAGRSMERQKKYHDEELADIKERFEADSELTAERNETIVADLKQRIGALQAQVDGQGTQSELDPQAKAETVAVEGEEAKELEEVVAVAVQKKHQEWESWVEAAETKAEKKFKDLQEQLANATERISLEKNRADNADSQLYNAQQTANNQYKRAEDAEQQVQTAQQNANQAWTKAQNAELQLQNYQKHVDEMWTTARNEAQQTLHDHEKRAHDAETQLQNAQKTAKEASDRAKDAEDSLKKLQDRGTHTGTSSTSPLPSAALSDPTQATGPTNTPPQPSTAPLYNPTCLPAFGGGAAGTTRSIPTTSSIRTTSISDLARYFTDKYNLPGPNGTSAPTIPGLRPTSTSNKLSGLPGPSNSSPPYIPGLNGPVFTPTNPTALPGTGPVPSPFNPVTRPGKGPAPNPFNPNAPPTHIPTVGIPDENAMDTSSSGPVPSPFNPVTRPGKGPVPNPFKPNAPPTHIPTVGIPDENAMDTSSSLSSAPPSNNEDAMSDISLNDISNFSKPKDNKRDAVDSNKASADVMAGRKIAKPCGRRSGASAGKA